ncbi:hypothetical protein ASPWEDRAFT_183850 [Aspergillus wentii DTO 134E9]|uniref:Uncharacterized protein n=1 Tax=Aspergillus wentii DTO 134E9 TaxID=1073089 RepID=A0A1L9RLS1_ASPWE|nr:uncharacterized protein ASPWEDRAFT_183850 [Aspergillus wentii DTO 134E9]KAI9929702.1 hypothetical protein MW887_001178 [Aspergillus wentii]OJJ35844.1 hypothetical protein ASPWEDRAFT_183850 [Aspergillus wentii DTO 134E9]
MTFPYPMIGQETYRFSKSRQNTPATTPAVTPLATPAASQLDVSTPANASRSSSTSSLGWKQRISRRFHF